MREDTNTYGLRQWFHFSVSSRKVERYKFRIYKFSKYYSLYRDGMKPYICEDQLDWRQDGENVKYEYDEELKCFYVEFEYKFVKPHQKIFIAAQPPYTYSRLKDYLGLLVEQYPEIKIKKVGETLSGLDMPLIKICKKEEEREAVIVLARTHPGETASSFSIETFIERIM